MHWPGEAPGRYSLSESFLLGVAGIAVPGIPKQGILPEFYSPEHKC